MYHVTQTRDPADIQPIVIHETRYGILIQNQTAFADLTLNIYLLSKPQKTGLLVACWSQAFNNILDACKSPNYWGGFYSSAKKYRPMLAKLITNTVSGLRDETRIFMMPDPDDGVQKWVVGTPVGSYPRFVTELNQALRSPAQRLPMEYRELVAVNQKLVNELIYLSKYGISMKDRLNAPFITPSVPMPSPAIFNVTGIQAAQPSMSNSRANTVVEVLENVVDAGNVVSGKAGDVVAGGVLGGIVKKSADETIDPFDTSTPGALKARPVMLVTILILIPFAILTAIFSSAKPLGLGIVLIGLYFFITAKAILTPGASQAYFEGTKARIVGVGAMLLGLIIIIAI
jgi:hypothetical protein